MPSNWTKPVRGNQTEQHEKKEAELTLNIDRGQNNEMGEKTRVILF